MLSELRRTESNQTYTNRKSVNLSTTFDIITLMSA